MTTRSSRARWESGLRCVVNAGRFELTVDEPVSAGGTDEGPQPTDLLLASIASCFTVAVAYAAAKRDIELTDLEVTATGVYKGPKFAEIVLDVRSGHEPEELHHLVTVAEKLCYVSNTLKTTPDIKVVVSSKL